MYPARKNSPGIAGAAFGIMYVYGIDQIMAN